MYQYETVFILNPVLSDEQIRETVDKFTGYLEARGSEIINKENWGLKRLAYPIQKKKSGFYQMIEFNAPGNIIGEYELQLKRDERIMRFLTIRMEKDAKKYSDKRRKLKANANA